VSAPSGRSLWDRAKAQFWGLVVLLLFIPVIPAVIKQAMPTIVVCATVLGSVLLVRWLWQRYRRQWW